jgi:predicted kinase
MPTVHLVCGPAGAGKTTYARLLAARRSAVCFTLSEWMERLYGAEMARPPSPGWLRDRMARIEAQMWTMVEQNVRLGRDVVLDVELTTLEERDRFRTRVAETPAACKLHYLDVDRETRWARVVRRAEANGKSRDEAETAFASQEVRFEPPTDDELYEAMILCE